MKWEDLQSRHLPDESEESNTSNQTEEKSVSEADRFYQANGITLKRYNNVVRSIKEGKPITISRIELDKISILQGRPATENWKNVTVTTEEKHNAFDAINFDDELSGEEIDLCLWRIGVMQNEINVLYVSRSPFEINKHMDSLTNAFMNIYNAAKRQDIKGLVITLKISNLPFVLYIEDDEG